MSTKFTVVGENIHCTLVYKVGGAFVKTTDEGPVIRYTSEGREQTVPIPESFTETEDWEKGRVKHAAAAMWQGMYGDEPARAAATAYIQHMAARQEAKGASYLDLNVDEFSTDIEERTRVIRWVAEIIQSRSPVPLSVDSSNMDILRAGLQACDPSKGRPMVNSVSLERQEAIEIAKEAGAVVVAGATGAESMPGGLDDRLCNCRSLMGKLRDAGFTVSDVYFDPLVFPVSVDPKNGVYVLDAITALRDEFGPGVHFAPGLSNISFGMPNRKLLNQVYAYLCRDAGMDGAIVNPIHINEQILDGLDMGSDASSLARAFLTSEDEYGMEYIGASREGRI